MTSKTSGIAVDIASDKSLTNQLLSAAGLPVPRAEVVETDDEAVAAAERLGYPVVVKPLDGNHGRGVGLNLRDADAVRGRLPGGASARAGAATWSSRRSSPATTTASSSSAASWRRWPSASRPR